MELELFDKEALKRLVYWIKERYSILQKKDRLLPKPWTKDPILQKYKFCNVFREDDRVTKWVMRHWRYPHHADADVWFAMVVARLINWPESLEEIGYPVPWKPMKFMGALNRRRALKKKVFTGAYMIHADAGDYPSKADYLAMKVLNPMWEKRQYLRPREGDYLLSFYNRLHECRDMGSFMAGQVVADVKFTDGLHIAPDWWTFAVPGPGSKRGLNRVCGREIGATWSEHHWLSRLRALRRVVEVKLAKSTARDRIEVISAQDLQNCLCEFDKYDRVRLGQGRPRSLYAGV